jgi:acetyl esterase
VRPKWLETAERAVTRRLCSLPPKLQVLLSGRPAVVIEGETLHPNMQLLLTLSLQANRARTLSHDDVAIARKRMLFDTTRFGQSGPEVGSVRDLTVPGPAGPLRARHYAPMSETPQPLLVYLHGGGFALGALESHDVPCRILCRKANVHVLSVDYRLAPEHPYPAAADDAVAAFRFGQNQAQTLGADPDAVAIGGDSAGGQLAAVVAQRTRGDRPPRAQLLMYPSVDIGGEWPSHKLFSRGFFLTAVDIAWFNQGYLAGRNGADDPGLAPLRAADLSGLAPAVIVTCGFDPLRDEGEAYAKALEHAGTKVTFWREHGLLHGFAHMAAVAPIASQAMDRVAAALAQTLRSSGAR